MALSAEAVARRVMSGENFKEVIPRACARGMVKRGVKHTGLGFSAGSAGGRGEVDCNRERSKAGEYDLDSDLEARRVC